MNNKLLRHSNYVLISDGIEPPFKSVSHIVYSHVLCTCVNMQAASYGSNGDIQTAKNHFGISIGCTVTGVIFSVVGLIVIIIAAVVSAANATSSVNRNF